MSVSLKETRRRIKSTRNTWKMTKAMEMVSAARLKKMQNRLYHTREYFSKMEEIKNAVLKNEESSSPFMVKAPVSKNIAVIIFSADRGLCGSYNSNLTKRALAFLEEVDKKQLEIHVLGKKALNFILKKYSSQTIKKHSSSVLFDDIQKLSKKMINVFLDKKIDEVFLVYTKFITTTKHQSTVEKIIPFDFSPQKDQTDFLFEPQSEILVEKVINDYIVSKIYQRYLESQTSEFAARMIAMQQASENALEMIDALTLLFNKARQSQITKEILEVISGAEALR